MLKMTAMSLALGLLALMLGIYIFYLPSANTPAPRPLTWDAGSASVAQGVGSPAGRELLLKLNENGQGVILLPISELSARQYPFLHLSFPEAPKENSVVIMWTTRSAKQKIRSYPVIGFAGTSLWLSTREMRGWKGDIIVLGIMITGQPGEAVEISKIELLPPSFPDLLKTLYSSWTSFSSWQISSVNTHRGVRSASSALYPVPVIAALLALSLLSYALVLALLSSSARFDWRVVASLSLACWVGLDLLWQGRLLRQVGATYDTFSGKNTQEQLAVGVDAELVGFIQAVRQRLEPANTRVFVSSTNEYRGMRGAYYLYPFNVYWHRHGPELPQQEYLRSGDYIVQVEPTAMRYDTANTSLITAGEKVLPAELIFSARTGKLLRVK